MDVNVTPDKRQVFVQEEKVLLATIKTSLKRMYDPSTASFDINYKPLTQIVNEMIALLTTCLFFPVLVRALNCISKSARENCVRPP